MKPVGFWSLEAVCKNLEIDHPTGDLLHRIDTEVVQIEIDSQRNVEEARMNVLVPFSHLHFWMGLGHKNYYQKPVSILLPGSLEVPMVVANSQSEFVPLELMGL